MTNARVRTLPPKAIELGKSFLSALFMGVRTAKVHDAQNRAFDRAIDTVREAADALYAATGGFAVQFIDDVLFLNGTRVRFEGNSFEAMRALRGLLEQLGIGGLHLRHPPNADAIRRMVLLLAQAQPESEAKDALRELNIGALRVRHFEDLDQGEYRADLKIFASQCYAKLILASREQRLAAEQRGTPSRPRLRAIRVMQDLADIAEERIDYLIRLGMTQRGAGKEDLHAANVAVLSMALGHAIGLRRQALVDLGMGGLLHDVGRLEGDLDSPLHPHAALSFAWLFHEGTMSRAMLLRAVIAGEHHWRPTDTLPWGRPLPLPNLFSRLIAVVEAFDAVSSGLGSEDGSAKTPLESLALLRQDTSGRFDPQLVDLLVNLLRAYPVGCRVVLDDGRIAVVKTHAGGARWDRPIVVTEGTQPAKLDLMVRDGERFRVRIVATARAVGRE